MATSGSVDYTCTARNIVDSAFEDLGLLATGDTLTADDLALGLKKLNILVKQIQGDADFSQGIKTWSRKTGYVFLQKDQSKYTLGYGGDKAATSYVQTVITANAALGASTLTLSSVSGVSSGYSIGLVQNDGSVHWTTVNGAPAGNVVTLTAVTTVAADSGAVVFVYSAGIHMPLEILTASIRDTSSNDTPLVFMDVYSYERIGQKYDESTPSRVFYDPKKFTGDLYLDCYPSDTTQVVRIVFLAPIEDLDSSTDDVDYPQHFYRYLVSQLGIDLSIPYKVSVSPEMKMIRDEAMAVAKNYNSETTTDYFQPGLE
jgi:hypothetical protein